MILSTQRANVLNSLLPYNGADGFMPCLQHGAEEAVSRPPDDNSKAAQDFDTVKESSRVPRPASFNHAATARNGFLSRFCGSTQASPEPSLDFDSPPDSLIRPSRAVLDNDTRNLIGVFLLRHTGLKHPRCSQPKALATMDRVVKSLVKKHEIAYKGMVNRLNLDERGSDMSFMTAVATEMFSDGKTNWGRIASLIGFSAVLCDHLKTRKQEHCIDEVASLISSYLLTHQRDWLINNKEWDGFVEFFHEVDLESVVRGALMTLAGVAGLGAGLAFLIR